MSPWIAPVTIDAVSAGSSLHLRHLSGDVVRITCTRYDGFDADLDRETLEGDFLIEDLRAALLAVAATMTAPVPVQSSRPGRRKSRWWKR